jgi:hypothetical protein
MLLNVLQVLAMIQPMVVIQTNVVDSCISNADFMMCELRT